MYFTFLARARARARARENTRSWFAGGGQYTLMVSVVDSVTECSWKTQCSHCFIGKFFLGMSFLGLRW